MKIFTFIDISQDTPGIGRRTTTPHWQTTGSDTCYEGNDNVSAS